MIWFPRLSVSHFIEVVNTEESFTGSTSQTPSSSGVDDQIFFASLNQNASKTIGGKASLQPKRTPMSNEEIEAILVREPVPICLFAFNIAYCIEFGLSLLQERKQITTRYKP